MMPSAIGHRPDQIGELTRGLRLPLPAVDIDYLELIAETLSRAFQDVRSAHPQTVASGDEAEVTTLLEARLNALLGQDSFWTQLVVCVARGKESVSFDGSHLEKRPDLSIYLSDRSRNFPLIAEAKVLDCTTKKTVKLYCNKGLCRFLQGEYAWANQEAFMLGYVRDGSSINKELVPLLSKDMTLTPARYGVQVLPTAAGNGTSDLAWSQHNRPFAYIHKTFSARVPGPITVWHLWLS